MTHAIHLLGSLPLAMAVLQHSSGRQDLLVLSASRVAAWVLCSALFYSQHRYICSVYPSLRSLGRWLNLAAWALTVVWVAVVFHPPFGRGVTTPFVMDALFAAGLFMQSTSLALIAPWLPVAVFPRHSMLRLAVGGGAIAQWPIAHFSPQLLTGGLLLLTAVLMVIPRRTAGASRQVTSESRDGEEAALLGQLSAIDKVLALSRLRPLQLLPRR